MTSAERLKLAALFSFVRTPLPVPPGPPQETLRRVNPSLAHIASWISSVGAAVALATSTAQGCRTTPCFVDTRTNRVIVALTPGSGSRYAPFALDFSGLRYDGTMARLAVCRATSPKDRRPNSWYISGDAPRSFSFAGRMRPAN